MYQLPVLLFLLQSNVKDMDEQVCVTHLSCIISKQNFAYAKTKAQISFAVTVKPITAIVFATIPQLSKSKLPPPSHLLSLYSSVCVRPLQKPCWFSHEAAHLLTVKMYFRLCMNSRYTSSRLYPTHSSWE